MTLYSSEYDKELFLKNLEKVRKIFRNRYDIDVQENKYKLIKGNEVYYYDSEIVKNLMKNNDLIHRFLFSKNLDLKEAYKMFDNMMLWRKLYEVDLCNTWKFKNYDNIKELYPRYWHSYSKQGYPVCIEKPGEVNLNELLKITTIDDMLRLYTFDMEYMVHQEFNNASIKTGRKISKVLSIVDLNNIKVQNINTEFYKYFKQMVQIGQNNYPEITYKIYLVNVTGVFDFVWKFISRWVNERTRKKIIVLKKGNLEPLLEDINPENLPVEYGGRCTTCINNDCEHGSENEINYQKIRK